MNRFIIARLALVSFLAAIFAAGCAFEQASADDDDQTEQGDESSGTAGFGTSTYEQTSTGEGPMLQRSSDTQRPDNSVCAGCGPLPDPWKKMGPLPDPWTSSSGGSTSSGGTNSDGKSK
ncbi:MAG: hypothetical protein BGO98_32470 [Myxococcales bacterium 68-20]|nr:hypothetical protein [Myxococcales bacterium]OJY18451.1 MAG: hypothetical protein BGO98_32470 [Myxococcales bacterium 68-20]